MKNSDFCRVAVLLSLALLVLVGTGCNSVQKKNDQADVLAGVVLKLLDAEQTDTLYENYTTESFRQANSKRKLQKLGKALHMCLGTPEKHVQAEYRIRTVNGKTSGKYLYDVQWAKADGTLLLKLEWGNGAWRIRTLDIQSPAIHDGRKDKPAGKPAEKPVENRPTVHI